jgi:hypothetical protein
MNSEKTLAMMLLPLENEIGFNHFVYSAHAFVCKKIRVIWLRCHIILLWENNFLMTISKNLAIYLAKVKKYCIYFERGDV